MYVYVDMSVYACTPLQTNIFSLLGFDPLTN